MIFIRFLIKSLSGKALFLVFSVNIFTALLAQAVTLSKCTVNEPEKPDKNSIFAVNAQSETTPVPRSPKEDSADDPAIWIQPFCPDSSRIIGTDKKGGLAVYDLKGNELFYYADGQMNNVDLRYGFAVGDKSFDILAVSNRTTNSVNLYKIYRNGSLEKIQKRELLTEMTGGVYGLCMYKSQRNGKFYVFINDKKGAVEQWELFADENRVDGKIVRKLKLETQDGSNKDNGKPAPQNFKLVRWDSVAVKFNPSLEVR